MGTRAPAWTSSAQEAGVVRRTLYNQFPEGKEALFHSVVEQVWSAFPVLDITTDADALADPEVGLRRIGQAVADFWAPQWPCRSCAWSSLRGRGSPS